MRVRYPTSLEQDLAMNYSTRIFLLALTLIFPASQGFTDILEPNGLLSFEIADETGFIRRYDKSGTCTDEIELSEIPDGQSLVVVDGRIFIGGDGGVPANIGNRYVFEVSPENGAVTIAFEHLGFDFSAAFLSPGRTFGTILVHTQQFSGSVAVLQEYTLGGHFIEGFAPVGNLSVTTGIEFANERLFSISRNNFFNRLAVARFEADSLVLEDSFPVSSFFSPFTLLTLDDNQNEAYFVAGPPFFSVVTVFDLNSFLPVNEIELKGLAGGLFFLDGTKDSVIGDVNGDGLVNLLDVSPFVALLTSGNFQSEADINQDGEVDLLDVAPFVDLLTVG